MEKKRYFFTERHISSASIFGPIAAGILICLNLVRLGKVKKAYTVAALLLVFTFGILYGLSLIPYYMYDRLNESIVIYLFPFIMGSIVWLINHYTAAKKVNTEIKAGALKGSQWIVAGAAVSGFLVYMSISVSIALAELPALKEYAWGFDAGNKVYFNPRKTSVNDAENLYGTLRDVGYFNQVNKRKAKLETEYSLNLMNVKGYFLQGYVATIYIDKQYQNDDITAFLPVIEEQLETDFSSDFSLILEDYEGFYAGTQTMGSMTDSRDGQTYRTVSFTKGRGTWLAENLNYDSEESWCLDNDLANCSKFGRLYTWEMATKVCPEGWSLPADLDWRILIEIIEEEGREAGNDLKSNSDWKNEGNGSNFSGFNALPAGGGFFVKEKRLFEDIGEFTVFWSSTAEDNDLAFVRELTHENSNVLRYTQSKKSAFSCRCIKD